MGLPHKSAALPGVRHYVDYADVGIVHTCAPGCGNVTLAHSETRFRTAAEPARRAPDSRVQVCGHECPGLAEPRVTFTSAITAGSMPAGAPLREGSRCDRPGPFRRECVARDRHCSALGFVGPAARQSRPEWPERRERTGARVRGPARPGGPLQSWSAVSGGVGEPETSGRPSRRLPLPHGLGRSQGHEKTRPGIRSGCDGHRTKG